MLKKYSAVIFDFDGTLIYTLDDIRDSLNYTLRRYNIKEKSLEEVRNLVGEGACRLVELCVHGGKDNVHFEEIFNLYRSNYSENYKNKSRPYPEVISMLEILKNKGYKMAVVSNKYDNLVKYLNHIYFGDLIPVAIGESEKIRKKPSPDGILEALKNLNSTIEDAVYVGDSDVDIQTAKNVGIDCISVSYGYRDLEILEKCGAVNIAHKPMEILNYL